MQNLTKEWKHPPAVILQQATFNNILILCLWLRIIKKIQSNCLAHEFSFADSFFNSILHDYGKVRRMMRTAIVLYLLNYF